LILLLNGLIWKKGHIKDTLDHSYTKNIDYKIFKSNPTGKKRKPKEIILLTPKCFKLMVILWIRTSYWLI
jgi:hypothetical protein